MVTPISPSEVASTKVIPDIVIETVNELISKNFDGTHAFTIKQKDVIRAISQKLMNQEVPTSHVPMWWLDFETLYGKYGWKVEYEGPGFNESYDAYFTFIPKK